ncbi:MAG: tetratricopeptide repeat protein, partial [Bacteroidota bacterium]
YLKGLFERSILFQKYSDYDSAIYYASKCIEQGEKYQNAEYIGKGYNQMGAIYTQWGDEQEGLKYYLDALDVFKEAGFQPGIGASLFKIGNYYLDEKMYPRAASYFKDALPFFKQANKKRQICGLLNNLGVIYLETDQPEKAIDYFQQSLDYAIVNDFYYKIPLREINLGRVYLLVKNYHVADSLFSSAYQHASTYEERGVQCQSLSYQGTLYREIGQLKTSLKLYHRALQIARAYKLKRNELSLFEKIAEAYGSQKEYENAYGYLAAYKHLNDSLNNADKINRTAMLLTRFDLDRKNEELETMRRNEESYNMQLRTGIVIVSLLTLLLVVGYMYYQIKQRSMTMDLRHKEMMNQKKVDQLLTEMELGNIKSKLEGQELERKRVAQELHDGIGGSLAGIKLNLINIEKSRQQIEEDLSTVIDRVDVVCEEVRAVAHDLIPPSFADNSLSDLIAQFISRYARIGKTKFYYELYPKREIDLLEIHLQVELYRIIQELIVNIRKHAKATEVNLSLILHDQYINLLVEDDGVGFDKDHQVN